MALGDVLISGQSFGVISATRHAAESRTSCSDASRMILVGNDLTNNDFAGCLRLMKRSLSCRIESMLDSSGWKGSHYRVSGPATLSIAKARCGWCGSEGRRRLSKTMSARCSSRGSWQRQVERSATITLLASRLFIRSVCFNISTQQ